MTLSLNGILEELSKLDSQCTIPMSNYLLRLLLFSASAVSNDFSPLTFNCAFQLEQTLSSHKTLASESFQMHLERNRDIYFQHN